MPVGGRLAVNATGGRIVAQLQRISAAGAQVTGRVTVTDQRRVEGRLQGRVANLSQVAASAEMFLGRPRGSLLPVRVDGPLTLDTRLAGTIDAPTVTGAVNAPGLSVGTAEDVALSADVLYAPAAVTIRRADVTWQQARANLAGRVGLTGDRRLDLTIGADAIDLPAVLRTLNQASVPASGTISARGTVGGTVARPVANIAVQAVDLMAYEEPLGVLNADVGLEGRNVTVSPLIIDKPQPDQKGRISATGAYNLDTMEYSFDLQSQALRLLGVVLPSGQRLRGDVQLAGRGAGSVSSPAGNLNLTLASLEVEGWSGEEEDRTTSSSRTSQLGRVMINAVAANKQAAIDASAERFNLVARAQIGLTGPWPTTLELRAENLSLAALPLPLAATLEGQLRATVDAAGNLAEPARGQATINIGALAGSLDGEPFSVTTPARLRYADERLAVERLQFVARDSSLVVSGELPLTDRAGQGQITVEGRANLATLAQYVPRDTNVAGDGEVTLSGSIRGTLKAIDPDLVVSVENGLILSPQLEPGLSNIRLRARVANGEANIEQLAANWGTAMLDASGRIPLEVLPELPVEIPRKGGPATFKGGLHGLDPAAIPGAPAGLGGRISLDAQVAASRAELGALDGRLTFPELEARVQRPHACPATALQHRLCFWYCDGGAVQSVRVARFACWDWHRRTPRAAGARSPR